ncbi:MAG: BrnA antitoxin family protein [Acetobacteraceae bacterium]|nr:BrnA antitoxin family protein [Acetobacteraceae bacterium]
MDTSKKPRGLSETQADLIAQLQAAANLPDSQIDATDPDATELPDWADAVRGKFYRPTKTLKSLRVDSDVLAYFQSQGKGYQTRINQILRTEMLRGLAQSAKAKRS